jgi:hypothetical protein
MKRREKKFSDLRPTDEEVFALGKLFSGSGPVDVAIASQAYRATVLERTSTGCGGFATFRFPFPFPPEN